MFFMYQSFLVHIVPENLVLPGPLHYNTHMESNRQGRHTQKPSRNIGKDISSLENYSGDFRLFLQQELARRCQGNHRYSLRAFAKSLQVAPSALSDMLNGKRSITKASIEKLSLSIGLSLKQIEYFQSKAVKSKRNGPILPEFQQLTSDQFAFISDWYHYAILELTKIQGFTSSLPWIARNLGITRTEANAAVERLMRLGLLGERGGEWVDISEGYTTNLEPGLTNSAARYLQKQILEQSLLALATVPRELRDHTSMTMAIDPRDLPEAIERIKKFRRELCVFLERRPHRKEIYQLSISLFPVTETQKQKEN
jgi:uncharacterized protein (TIGR02147 family)